MTSDTLQDQDWKLPAATPPRRQGADDAPFQLAVPARDRPSIVHRDAAPSQHANVTVRPAPSRPQRGPHLPVDAPQTLELGGSTAPSSVGALVLLLLVATLTGILLVAAPGLGRRIRPARRPTPRSRYRRRIDLPG
jgi:hypothetical protein